MASKRIGLVLFLLMPTLGWGEDVSVEGVRPVQVDTYRGVAHIFRRFDAFPMADRRGLSLRMTGTLEPGRRPIQEAMPYIADNGHTTPLFAAAGDEMRLPDQAGLWSRNPPILAPLGRDRRIVLGFRIVVAGFTGNRFTKTQASGWLRQLDACIADEAGPVAAFLLPNTHKLSVMVMPGARLEVQDGPNARLLVKNGGTTPYRFTFRPQDFASSATFVSTQVFGPVFMEIPFSVHGTWKRNTQRGTYQAGR